MCRYGTNSYKQHYACFECRKTFKRRLLIDIDREVAYSKTIESQSYKCPECGGLTANMGLDFKSPPKKDLKAWNHVERLYETGITFHSCGCSGPGYIPKDKESLIQFLEQEKEVYIKHRRFWSNRIEPENESERNKDQNKNCEFLFSIPSEFKTGTKKNRKVNLEKAVQYWGEKIELIERYIKKITNNYIN